MQLKMIEERVKITKSEAQKHIDEKAKVSTQSKEEAKLYLTTFEQLKNESSQII